MSLVLRHEFPEAHSKNITNVAFNSHRRELYVAGEDGIINVWEMDTHKLVNTFVDHSGWITGLVYCKDYKVLISCSLDGNLNVWNSSGKILQKIQKASPIYGISYDPKRQQILLAMNKVVHLHHLKTPDEVGLSTSSHGSTNINDVILRKFIVAKSHTDIVNCVATYEGRFVSAGYDKRIVIYEQAHSADTQLQVSHVIRNAHGSAITTLTTGKDADNTWLITGSYDCVVKLWSMDGILLKRLEGFSDQVSSICYIIPTQTLWISANSPEPVTFDPRSGVNISDFVESPENTNALKSGSERVDHTSKRMSKQSLNTYKQFLYVPDSKEVIGVTHRRNVRVWRYEITAPLTVLKATDEALECATVTLKEPILIFTCGENGEIHKWERLQLNPFMYSQEILYLNQQIQEWHKSREPPPVVQEEKKKQTIPENPKLDSMVRNLVLTKKSDDPESEASRSLTRQIELLSSETQKAFKRSLTLMTSVTDSGINKSKDLKASSEEERKRRAISKLYYYDELEYLICGSHDGNICNPRLTLDLMCYEKKFTSKSANSIGSLLSINGFVSGENDRVSGLLLRSTLSEHRESVTSFFCVTEQNRHWMVSSGWDRRICIWDLDAGTLKDVFKDMNALNGQWEIAADGIVADMDYSPENSEFAYCSSDKLAYIRKFSTNGQEMTLKAVLHGHSAEVTHIKWFKAIRNWVTASDDKTIRLWHENGLSCLRTLTNESLITAILIDEFNNCIVTGSTDNNMRIFDLERKDIFAAKIYRGHTNEVRSIVHIPPRKQYVSVSWDGSLRIWNAYSRNESGVSSTLATLSSEQSTVIPPLAVNTQKEEDSKAIKGVKQAIFERELDETVKEIERALQ